MGVRAIVVSMRFLYFEAHVFRYLLFLFLKLGFLNSILHGDFAERITCDAEMAVGMRSATGYAEVGLYY